MKKVSLFLLIPLLGSGPGGCKKGSPEKPKEAIVYTIAGTGVGGYSNGFGPASKFDFPSDVAVGKDGTIYITDQFNYRVRKLATDDVVYPFAGNGIKGNTNGNAAGASFGDLVSIIMDANGDLYVLDDSYAQVKKISPGLDVSAFAGAGFNGFADGAANTAQFNQSRGITTDGKGTIYVADTYNNRIRKIKNGQVSTVAGTGTAGYLDGNAAEAQFNQPRGIAIDRQGNIYVCDRTNYRIRKITPAGIVSTVAGSGMPGNLDGMGSMAGFYLLGDMVIDKKENLYVIDGWIIRKITPKGEVSRLAGLGTPGLRDGEARFAEFDLPSGLAIDEEGSIYVADAGNHCIRKIIFH